MGLEAILRLGSGRGARRGDQIWTDVDGVMSADPKLVPGARSLETISFAEAAELSYYGARVLHPASIAPAVRRRIPVRVLNSQRPEGAGTRIVLETGSERGALASVAPGASRSCA
jgi:aspartate kinase